MNKKKMYKKMFSKQIAEGFQFKYYNDHNTIEEYCLRKNSICIRFVEDYTHEFLNMEIRWKDHVKLVGIEGVICCSRIPCKNQKEVEKRLREIEDKKKTMSSDEWYNEIVNICYEFLDSNNFFEELINNFSGF